MAASDELKDASTAIPINEVGDNEIAAFMRYFVSSLLPYAIVFGSVMLKVPQIIKVLQHQSAEGISLSSLCFELTSCVITTSWGIAQSMHLKDFGENMFIMLEMALLLILVGYFQGKLSVALSAFIAETMVLIALSAGVLSHDFHEWLLSIQILFGLSSRVPQIIMNHKNQSTGHLSFLTFYLALVGGLSRLLTTFHNVSAEQGRNVLLTQFGVSVALNTLIILQILIYKKNTEEKLKLAKKKGSVSDGKKHQ
ncbi:putative SNF2 DNA repair protein [Trypanosoma theileri]|uniref:Mannose-P-dolichol utilization defect 1 protein homolog n=1 Tax=Trypanosoma theileri TaxID=67003 RepID=A0A1X0NQ59_9TRYP|nr:putative SNF2 DNA repair protein [Trypanosoma theileri]ORC86270.1 putative SNF2 DNA repair protein [Trypanosoma theileri]